MPSLEPTIGPASSLMTALRLLRERWWVLVLCVVLGALAFVANDARHVKQYQATATLLFGTTGSNVAGLLNTAASNVSSDPQRDQGTTLLLVASSSVANRVKTALKYPGPSSDLSAAVTATAEPDANLIDVNATDPDPARAALLANTFAQQYQAFRRDSDRAGLKQGISSLEAQYQQTAVQAVVQRQSLRNSLTALQSAQALTTGGVQVVDLATPPGSPSSPRPKRDGLLGVILGLAIGAAIIFGVDLFDRRLKVVRDFEVAYAQSALAAVPLQRDAPRDATASQAALEPYRILRASLGQINTAGRSEVVLVTSAVPGEGKSTTAAGLARAVAISGQHVALVELDLRRPTFHQSFLLPRNARGLTSVLLGQAELSDVLIKGVSGVPGLEILPAGGTPDRSSEMLGGAAMAHILDELAERFDVVVLDAPPLLPVADTHVMLDAPQVDTCIIVGRPYVTTRDQATRARGLLQRHGRLQYGLVVNGLRREEGSYQYEYGPASGEAPGAPPTGDLTAF